MDRESNSNSSNSAGEIGQRGSGLLTGFEKILAFYSLALAFFHLLTAAFKYVLGFYIIDIKAAWGLGALVGIYLFISLFIFPWNLKRIRSFVNGLLCYEQIYLIFLPVWFFISIVINQKISGMDYIIKNKWELYDTLVNAFLIFPMARLLRGERAKKTIETGLFIVLSCYTAFSVYALYHIIHMNFIKTPTGNLLEVIPYPMALRFGTHYNVTSAMSFTMLLLCLYFFLHENTAVRIASVLFFPVHLFVCNLSNSRTIFITGAMVIPLFLFFCIWNRYSDKTLRFRLVSGILTAGAGLGLFILSREYSFLLFEKWSHFNEIMYGAENGINSSLENIRGIESNFNGRGKIWMITLKRIFSDPIHFLFGVTPAYLTIEIEPGEKIYNAHNIILNVGLSFGVPAMIAYCFFLFRICMENLRMLLFCRSKTFREQFVLPIITFGLVLPGIVETHIAHYTIMQSVFILISGWVLALSHKTHSVQDDDFSEKKESVNDPI